MPLKERAEPVGQASPPREEIRVTGILLPSEEAGRLGSRKPPGPAKVIARIDLELLGRQLPYPVYPLYVLLQDQDPPQPAGLPRLRKLPRLGEGPHLGYTMQWFAFGAVAVAGYGAVIRRAARERATKRETAPLPA